MFSPAYLSICLYCISVLSFLFAMESRRRNARSRNERYFLIMLAIGVLSFVADIMSTLYTGPDWLFPFAVAGNHLEIILNTALLPIFFHYICEQISDVNPDVVRKLGRFIWAMAALCSLMGISTIFTGKIFYFDSAHMYHRGELFFVPMTIMMIMMVVVEGFLYSQRKKIEVKYFRSLMFFLIAPLIGSGVQLFKIGLPFTLMGISFAALVLFITIQSRNMDKDYLTGAFNRQTLDGYLQQKIEAATPQKTFAAILLDIDEFKEINDSFGHYEGDLALIAAVKLLRDSVDPADFVARYGGDEFCVILDNGDTNAVADTVKRIEKNLDLFNESQNKPYRLGFSMGCATYDPSLGAHAETFYRVIDKRMYRMKRSRKAAARVR